MEVILGSPRGFCAGVVRAIDIVELALRRFGSPVYVRHEIVHNPFVVEELRGKGAIFVEELDEVPDGHLVIFSAHGVSPEVRREADRRGLRVIDATCPLVTKVHLEAVKYGGQEYTILLVGHRDHPETIGTSGEAPDKTIIVETVEDARGVQVPDPERVAALTQTTLSVDDTREIVDALRERFPNLLIRNDICYATTNRQMAAKSLAVGRRRRAGHRREQQLKLQPPARGRGGHGHPRLPGERSRRAFNGVGQGSQAGWDRLWGLYARESGGGRGGQVGAVHHRSAGRGGRGRHLRAAARTSRRSAACGGVRGRWHSQ